MVAAVLGKIGSGIGKAAKSVGKMVKMSLKQGWSPIVDSFKKSGFKEAKKIFKAQEKALKNKKGLKGATFMFKAMQRIGSAVMMPMNLLMSVLDKFGVVQPLLDIFGGVLALIGGNIMTALMPAIQTLTDVLFSDEMIEIWELLGTMIGEFLGVILTALAEMLSDPTFQKALMNIIKVFMTVGKIIISIIMAVLKIIGGLSASQLGAIIYALLIMIAFMKGMALAPGPWGIAIGLLFAGIAAAVLFPLLQLQEGGLVTRPTMAMLHAGEAVIPLDRAGEFGLIGGGGGRTINIKMEGGVYATDEYELARKIARKIQLYEM